MLSEIIIVLFIIYWIIAVMLSLRVINLIQLDGYKVAKSKKMQILKYKHIGIGVFSLILNIVFFIFSIIMNNEYMQLIAQGINLVIIMSSILDDRDKCYRQKLVFTARVKRLIVVYSIVFAIFMILSVLLSRLVSIKGVESSFLVLPIVFIFIKESVWIALKLNMPMEKAIANFYIKQCKKELDKKNIIKIGVTGSYGKTSVKNILTSILGEKYNTYCTPHNYNTPMGICKAVKEMPEDCEVFVVEMGARNVGDIKELCEIVKPDYGVLTGIAEQHLATFGSVDNICKTKKELLDYIVDNNKKGVFIGADEHCSRIYEEMNYCSKIKISYSEYKDMEDKNQKINAENVKYNKDGMSFDLVINGKREKCACKLIGKHNLNNILLSVAVANKLGLNIVQIAKGIEKIKPIEHRLELIKSPNGLLIIDDSYNSNPQGARMALDTLSMFEGRKIVASQGLVEMGAKQVKCNYELGEYMAKVVDIAILIGINNNDIRTGMLASGFCDRQIYMVKNLYEAQEIFGKILVAGDILLIQNDLPDNY